MQRVRRWSWLVIAAMAAAPAFSDCCVPEILARADIPISGNTSAWKSWIDADDGGNVYVGWTTYEGVARLSVSHDDGRTFGAPIILGGDGLCASHGAAGEDGLLAIAFCEGNTLTAVVSRDAGRTLVARQQLGLVSYEPPYPDLPTRPAAAITDDGAVVVAWLSARTAGFAEAYVSAASLPAGALTWLPTQELAPGQRLTSVVSVTTRQAVHVAFPGASAAVNLVTTTDGGASWSSVIDAGTPTVPTLQVTSLVETTPGHLVAGFIGADSSGQIARVIGHDVASATWDRSPTTLGSCFNYELKLGASTDGTTAAAWREDDSSLALAVSERSGEAGSWGAPFIVVPPADIGEDPQPVVLARGLVTLAHTDYRDTASCQGYCESVYVETTCDGAASIETGVRLDDDVRRETHSEDAVAVMTPSGLLHVAWVDWSSDNRWQLYGIGHSLLDIAPQRPRLIVGDVPATACAPPRQRTSVDPSSLTSCSSPTYQWWLDGAAVPGATAADFMPAGAGDHAAWVDVECASPPACWLRASAASVLRVGPQPPNPLELAELDGIVRVAFAPGGSALRLSWGDGSPIPTGYSAYVGSIGSLHVARAYDHVATECQVPRTGSLTTRDLAVPGRDAYFLIVPAHCLGEGWQGLNDREEARPLAGIGAPCGPMP